MIAGSIPARGSVTPDAILVQQPAIDFRTFLGLSHKVLGRSLAAAVDACRQELSDAERFLSCLAALRDEHAPVGLSPRLLVHVSFSAFIGADQQDMLNILQCCAGMSFVVAETSMRGVQAAIVTGTLAQWRDAVVSGSSVYVELPVRHCFNKLYSLFTSAGLNVWRDFRTQDAPDRVTFLLDDKRGR